MSGHSTFRKLSFILFAFSLILLAIHMETNVQFHPRGRFHHERREKLEHCYAFIRQHAFAPGWASRSLPAKLQNRTRRKGGECIHGGLHSSGQKEQGMSGARAPMLVY